MRKTWFVRRALLGFAALSVLLAIGVPSASSAQFHGIAFVKGCDDPTNIGAPYSCAYQILNVVDTGLDTLVVTGLSDQVHAAAGDVNSGNILGALQLTTSGGATCTGGTGSGTAGDPYVGATSCTLPFGSTIATNFHSFYSVQAGDYALPNHNLTDTASLNWHNTCTAVGIQNCTTTNQVATAGSSSHVNQLPSTTTTQIKNAGGQTVTAVQAGTTVHDFVSVTGQAGQPNPTGNVNIDWFTNGTCTAPAAANSGSIGPLDASGQLNAAGFPQTPATPGLYSFKAHYEGNATYTGSDGPCEPLQVVDARITISTSGTNEVGHAHTFTVLVERNDGTGWSAAAGTTINSTTDFGSITGGTCGPTGTTDAAGTCTVIVNSNIAGTAHVNAGGTVTVGGVSIPVATNGFGAHDISNQKTWVDASIGISPQDATNPTGTNHTFTVTVRKNDGSGFVAAAGEHVDVSIVNSGGATATINTALSTCDDAGANTNASGQCTLVISSPTAGTTNAFAAVTLTVGGVSLTRDANSTTPLIGHGPGGTDEATKHWEAPPQQGQITPTQVDCTQFASGTAPTLGQINYTTSGGKITQGINPGVFFFWTKITTTVPNQVVTVTQTNTSTNNAALFTVNQGWDRLYAGDCSSWRAGTEINGGSGASFTVPVPGDYIIGIKYQTKTIAGTNAPVPADITYNFATSLGGTTGGSVLLKKQ